MDDTLNEIRASMEEVRRLESMLEGAKVRRTQLATRLYEQHGPRRAYSLPEIPDVCGAVELLVSRTKPRQDGSVSYFFAEKQRWKGARAAVPVGRIVEATAVLTGRAEAGDEPVYDLSGVDQPALVGAILANAIPRSQATPPLLQSLSREALESVPVPSQAELEAAIEQGERDKAGARASRGGVRLPIARQAVPETKLLQIKEPEASPEVDLDDIMASLEGI